MADASSTIVYIDVLLYYIKVYSKENVCKSSLNYLSSGQLDAYSCQRDPNAASAFHEFSVHNAMRINCKNKLIMN